MAKGLVSVGHVGGVYVEFGLCMHRAMCASRCRCFVNRRVDFVSRQRCAGRWLQCGHDRYLCLSIMLCGMAVIGEWYSW